MIDFHSHILPNIDDGSSGLEESLRMLQKEAKDGVTDVVVTPHYYADRYSLDRFMERRNKSFEALKNHLTEEYPSIHIGAEVFISQIWVKPRCCQGYVSMIHRPYC